MIKSAIKISLMSGWVLTSCVSTAKNLPIAPPAAEPAANAEKGCMPSPEALDSLLLTVQKARESGDKAKMAAALAAMEIHIGEMKEKKKKCKGMMEDMMGGGGMMGMKGMKAKEADSAAAPAAKVEPKAAPSGHENHH